MSAGPKTAAIVVAGGSGERLGREGGKQLMPLAGRPVLAWSVRALADAEGVSLLVIVCPEGRRSEYESQAIAPLGLTKPVQWATSGENRQESVRNGLALVGEDCDIVVVHDGARPLVTPAIVSTCLTALSSAPDVAGVVIGHPAFDTLKIVDGSRIENTPDRSRFWAVQTPQAFRREALLSAHEQARLVGYCGTDDSSLVERLGETVIVVPGPRDNVKITVPEDVAYAEAVLRRREGER